jgi:hypothetical protein
MRTTVYGYRWNVISDNVKDIDKLPKTSQVYILTVKNPDDKRRYIVYIGVSRHLWWRIKTHEMLRLLRLNLNGYLVEILFRDFGGWTNTIWERKLIWHYKPPFNGTWEKERNKERHLFWAKCGVKKVVYKLKDIGTHKK